MMKNKFNIRLLILIFLCLFCSRVFAQVSELDELFKTINIGLDQDSNNQFYLKARGDIYTLRGLYEDAIKDYDHAIEIDSTYIEAYYYRGIAYHKYGYLDQAFKDIQLCVLRDFSPKDELYYNRGVIFQDMKKYQQALTDYEKVLEININYQKAYYNIGVVYLELEEYDNAKLMFNKSLELDSEDPYSIINRGYAFYKLGYFKKAIEDFQLTLKVDSSFIHAYKWMGLSYSKIGNLKMANFYLDKAKAGGIDNVEDEFIH